MAVNGALIGLTVAQLREGLRRREFSAVELVEAHILAAKRAETLGGYVTQTPEIARERANSSDQRISENKAGPLEGIPIAVKDLFCTKGVRTTAASKILKNFVPT